MSGRASIACINHRRDCQDFPLWANDLDAQGCLKLVYHNLIFANWPDTVYSTDNEILRLSIVGVKKPVKQQKKGAPTNPSER